MNDHLQASITIKPNLSGHASGGYEQFYVEIIDKGGEKHEHHVYSFDALMGCLVDNIGKIVLNGADDYKPSPTGGTQEWNRETGQIEVVDDDVPHKYGGPL